VDRYLRQIMIKAIGREGQLKLAESRVLLVGCGGLGTPVANILVRGGVGFMRIIDKDMVELSNLQRQSLFEEKDIEDNLPKATAAFRRLKKINSEVKVEAVVNELNPGNAADYIKDVDLILDGTDNFETRFIINNGAVKYRIPLIHGGVAAACGTVMNILPGEGPCLECIYPQPPAPENQLTARTVGVLGTITSLIGSIQANEAIKYLTGNKDKMMKGMLYIDLWDNTFESINISRRQDCNCCVKNEYRWLVQ